MNRRPFVWIAALALSGVAAGHAVAYYLAVPGTGQRNALLARSGHSYWSIAVTVAVLVELAGVLAVAVRGSVRGGPGPPRCACVFRSSHGAWRRCRWAPSATFMKQVGLLRSQ